jgi:hypothetical protein
MNFVIDDNPKVPVTSEHANVGDYFACSNELSSDDGIHRILAIYPHGITYRFIRPDGTMVTREASWESLRQDEAFYVAQVR